MTIARQLGLDPSTVSNFFMNARRRSVDKWKDENDENNRANSDFSHNNNHSATTAVITTSNAAVEDEDDDVVDEDDIVEAQQHTQPHHHLTLARFADGQVVKTSSGQAVLVTTQQLDMDL